MNIRPSAAIRQNDHEIAELCRGTQAPVYLTNTQEQIRNMARKLLHEN